MLTIDYLEPGDYVMENPVTTRWKPLRGTECVLPVKERPNDLQMDVLMLCPYENHMDVRSLAQQSLFSSFIICETNVRPYHSEKGDEAIWLCPKDSTPATSPSYVLAL